MPSTPAERLRQRIRSDGPIPFAAFMEESLYGGAGYYRRDRLPIGPAGDFVTGSAFSPLFGRATARLLRRLDGVLGTTADLLEVGSGSGAHLSAVAEAVAGEGRRLWAEDRVERSLPAGVERWAGKAESAGIRGLVFSYELFDAIPIHRLIGRDGGEYGELWVDLDDGGAFCWRESELSDPTLPERLGLELGTLGTGQIADLAPDWGPLYASLAGRLEQGLLVTCDYGFERERLLDRRRRLHGTLASYRHHTVHRDALRDAGEQDLTAHVDFTTLRSVGEEAGLQTVALTRQAPWLVACGLFDELREAPDRVRRDAQRLLDGEGMGEEIRVLVQARDIDVGAVLDRGLLI